MNGSWEKLNETLSCLSSFTCPTVIRMTLVEGYNMKHLDEYAKIIQKTTPTYIEAKAYMHIGYSGLRLSFNRMPTHKKILKFSEELSKKTGYKIIDQSKESRVVLLSKRKNPIKFNRSN
jgi:tRNA wybutosine-synthesizing protein 1